MLEAALAIRETGEQNERIARALAEQEGRLRAFLRNHLADQSEIEDILQDAFYELVAAYRLLKPIEHIGAWLFRVVQNRVTDAFRKQRPSSWSSISDEDSPSLEELLPSSDDGPEAAYQRRVLLAEIEEALDELPPEQRDVFIAHEVEGRSFKELAAEMGVSVNTLLARKRYAILHLRRRLEDAYNEYSDKGKGENK